MIQFFEYYIKNDFHLSNAIEEFKEIEPKFSLKKFNELLKKDKDFKERFEECKQIERDQVKEALKKLAVGIPIFDHKEKIIGWQEKPDIKAIEEIYFNLK